MRARGKSEAPPPVVVPIEVNLEIHQPGVEFVSENILEAKLGEEPWQVKLANFCRPCVRWKGRCCTLDFNGFVRAGICAIETQMAKEKKNG